MKKLTILSGSLFVAGLLLLSGCKKLLDYIEHHPGGVTGLCPIQTFSYKNGIFDGDTVAFSYNGHGNPVSAIRKHPGTGAPNSLFRYDGQDRLTDLIGSYTTEIRGIESWAKYFYDGTGRVVSDSVYFFPTIVDGNPTRGEFGSVWTDTYTYDAKDRIIETERIFEGSPNRVSTYSYNGDGNLVGPAAYDKKINFHQTNKIWMFLDRNYSINNPLTATYSYNNSGLPVKIDVTDGEMRFLEEVESALMYTNATIDYSCH